MEFSLPSSWINRPINICLVGVGGTGSALLTELFQMSFMLHQISEGKVYFNVVVYDDDEVSFANVGRQSFWGHDVGVNKATALVDRFNTFGGINWVAKPCKFSPSADMLKYDLLITCTDSAQTRADIGEYAKKLHSSMLWLDTGNDAYTGQVILGFLGKNIIMLPNVYDLYPSLRTIEDIATDSCSHIEALAKQSYGINKKVALEATCLLWELLRHSKINRHGAFVDVKEGITTPLPIDPVHWAMLGFKPKTKEEH